MRRRGGEFCVECTGDGRVGEMLNAGIWSY